MTKLTIKKLQAKIDKKTILKGVDLEVEKGQLHVIMGPNGSGKSTLANVLAGNPSYDLFEGKIKISDSKVNELSPNERAELGLFLAFQYPVEIPGLRVLNFLWEAYKTRFSEDERSFKTIVEFKNYLESVLEEVGLSSDFSLRGLNEGFSGGEKKRLEVAQMMVLQPNFAILDETDSGLDVDAIKIVARGIRRTQNRFGTGIIVITHYQRILQYLEPDFVHIMMDGKIVKTGDIELIEKIEQAGYDSFSSSS